MATEKYNPGDDVLVERMHGTDGDAASAAGIPVVSADQIVDDWDDEEEDDPFADPNYDIYVLKWACDGCATFDDVIATLKALAENFGKWKADGWELECPVDNSHMHMRRASDASLGAPST